MDSRILPIGSGGLYLYSSLPSPTHTRLLELQPSDNPTSELRCRLHCLDLYDVDSPLYEAVSYTWGDEAFSRVLWIEDNGSGSSRLLVTPNLADALCRFRRRAAPRFIWADAVCINQKDDVEKGTHLPLMTHIYRGAAAVLVWLGRGQEEEQTLARINMLGRLTRGQSRPLSDSHQQELATCLLSLVRLPWFSRRWIIQEVVMNSEIVIFCGAQQSSFLRLVHAFLWMSSTEWKLSREASGLIAIFDLWNWWTLQQNFEAACGLLRLIEEFDHFGCADGRDRVFNLAALADDVDLHTTAKEPPSSLGWSREVVVDYNKSVKEIYMSTAQMIANSGYLQWVLCQAMMRFDPTSSVILPTWVPDWRNPIQRRLFWDVDYTTTRIGDKDSYNRGSSWDPDCKIWSLAKTGIYLLRAKFNCVENWRSSIPDQYVDDWDIYNRLGEVVNTDDRGLLPDDSWAFDLTASLENNAIAPMVITWKSEHFPNMDEYSGVSKWVKSTFSTVWGRVLESLAEGESIPGDAALQQQAWDTCIDRFTWVITAGGKFLDSLDAEQQQDLARLCDLSEEDWSHPSTHQPAPGESGDMDSLQEDQNSKDTIQSWKLSSIVRRLVRGTTPNSPGLNGLFVLIANTMKNRCLFTCEVDWKPACGLAADILGIGTTRAKEGDRVLSFPSRDDDKLTWARTFLVRETSLNSSRDRDNALEEILNQHGRCRNQQGPPPAYEIIGDCFLSTTRWVSPIRGLQAKRWDIDYDFDYHYRLHEYSATGRLDNRNSKSRQYDIILV
ncbi:heterokaryon incompatibility protein-domain-containing protein [Ustulina deusta]|nr:heterokaryon incompatibility protein-domain-containing protein [Ustulina deusta]